MTALEARALTDERRNEKWVDFLVRIQVYPAIRAAAEKGESEVETILWPLWSEDWVEGDWIGEVEEAVDKLRFDGYSVENEAMQGMVSRRVRVTW